MIESSLMDVASNQSGRTGPSRPSDGLTGASLVAAGLVVLLAAGAAEAETGTFNLHFEGGAATFLTQPQTGYFGFGGSAAVAFEWSIIDFVGLEIAYLFGGFSEGTGAYARPDGLLHLIGGGVRLRLLNDTAGFALHVGDHADWHEGNLHGDLWVSAHVGYVRTGGLDRLGFDAGLGYELSLVDGFSVGPYVRYLQVIQPDDDPLDPADAMALAFGLAGTFCLTTCSVHVEPPDTDGDGIHDRVDACPEEPEDPDGFEDEDGCPEPDNDGDTIPDATDACPNEPEDFDGHRDDDGCPEPEIDTDGDTILDEDDGCPTEAEDADGFQDEDGCPDTDNDGDTIPDADDDCPNEAEVVNGVDDDDGCPDQALVRVEHDRIVLEEMVHFEFNTAVLRPGSDRILHAVAQVILAHPEYARVSVEGHTDFRGSAEFNLRLSEQRAERVRDVLVRMGVEPERLETRGFGKTRPIAEGQSLAANRRNRRVEFVIVQVGP
ncbi:MAG: OmpA family protein [Deltaproteobacteria bacterium]|nr:OmpA family protein [Deltaproteobacteria bacterium]